MNSSSLTKAFLAAAFLIAGIMIGGYFFADTQPRSFLKLHECSNTCWKANELTGLMASVGLLKTPALVPGILFETDKIVVVNYPTPNTPFHEVVIPKKDIKDAAQISLDDTDYVMEVFAYIRQAVEREGLKRYKVVTNGPGYQNMTYLHFHIIGDYKK